MTDGGYNTAVNSRADQLPTGRSCHVFLVFMEWRYTGQGGSGLSSLGPASEDGMRKFDAIPRVAGSAAGSFCLFPTSNSQTVIYNVVLLRHKQSCA